METCDNDTSMGRHIFSGGCYKGKQEVRLTIKYSPYEKDILYLCKNCAEKIKRDAKRHGYEVLSKRL